MIEPDKRKAILTLFEAGNTKRHIARTLKIDVKTVRKELKKTDAPEAGPRKNKIVIEEELLRKEFAYCNSYLERVHERLTEDYGLEIGYSTLTRRARELGLGKKASQRCCHVPDVPGEEMQYDTSVFFIKLNGKKTRLVCSGIYFRYSKIRYIKFYFSDNRFNMKCFFDEALRYWDYCAQICIIDNTCLAIWYGTGSNAVFHPEMEKFAANYGFVWKAHAVGHSNRKAGKEKNFATVIMNFLAGRTFLSLEDLNQQAFAWATERFAKRPQAKTKLIPIDTFEQEKPYLHKLPEYVPLPYVIIKPDRIVDSYGYISFDANYYWTPEFFGDSKERITKVKIIRYVNHIVLYYQTKELVRYNLPDASVKNEKFSPEGVSVKFQPKHRIKPSHEEENALRAMGQDVSNYVEFIRSKECRIRQKHHFLRRLHLLSGKLASSLFISAVKHAYEYRVDNVDTISRIAAQIMKKNGESNSGVDVEFDEKYTERDAYRQGCFNDEQDVVNLDLFSDSPENET